MSQIESINYKTEDNGDLDEDKVIEGLQFSSELISYQRQNRINVDELAKYMLDSDNGPLVVVSARKGDELVGFGVTQPELSCANRSQLELDFSVESLAVASDFRRQRIAGTILDKLEVKGVSLGATSFNIETISPSAIAFYKESGYDPITDPARQAGFVLMQKLVHPRVRPRRSR